MLWSIKLVHSIVSSPSHRGSDRTFFTVLARWSHHGRLASSIYFSAFATPLLIMSDPYHSHILAPLDNTCMFSFIHAWYLCIVHVYMNKISVDILSDGSFYHICQCGPCGISLLCSTSTIYEILKNHLTKKKDLQPMCGVPPRHSS
jgi:hypothetical protein